MTRAKGHSPYRIYLCGEDPTYEGSNCPGGHTLQPRGYCEWHDWAKTMGKTHKQRRCSVCGLWAIWEPKRQPSTKAETI